MSNEDEKVVVGKYGPFSMISMGLPGDHAGKRPFVSSWCKERKDGSYRQRPVRWISRP